MDFMALAEHFLDMHDVLPTKEQTIELFGGRSIEPFHRKCIYCDYSGDGRILKDSFHLLVTHREKIQEISKEINIKSSILSSNSWLTQFAVI